MGLFEQKYGLEVCLNSILMFNVLLYDLIRLLDACVLLKVNEKEVLSHQSTFFFIVLSISQCDVIIYVKYQRDFFSREIQDFHIDIMWVKIQCYMSFIILVERGVKYASGPLQPSKLNENIKFSD